MDAIFFNLFVNSVFSLLAGILVVLFFIWFFRIQTGPLKLFLLSAPFLKIVYDFFRGLPKDSVLLAGVNPLSLPPKHQYLTVSGDMSFWGPALKVQFSAKDLDGQLYATSIGDYLVLWIKNHLGTNIPMIILTFVLAVSLTLLATRISSVVRFEIKRRADRKIAKHLFNHQLRWRIVDVYISDQFSGTPFTGGILNPYICIPSDAEKNLNKEEVDAVIAHEMAHIKQFDLVGTIFVKVLGDIFWFIPGYRTLSKKIDRMREVIADEWAVKAGANPNLLASALVKLKEIPDSNDRFILYSAFFREKSLLKARVHRLLENETEMKSRFGWSKPYVHYPMAAWIFTCVFFTTFGGNHSVSKMENPKFIERLFKKIGI